MPRQLLDKYFEKLFILNVLPYLACNNFTHVRHYVFKNNLHILLFAEIVLGIIIMLSYLK